MKDLNEVQLGFDIKHLIEAFDTKKNEKKFFILYDTEWQEISQDEYNTIIRGEKNG